MLAQADALHMMMISKRRYKHYKRLCVMCIGALLLQDEQPPTSDVELGVAPLHFAVVQQLQHAFPHGHVEAALHPTLLEAAVHLGPRPEAASLGTVDGWVSLHVHMAPLAR